MKRFVIIASLILCASAAYAQSDVTVIAIGNENGTAVTELQTGMKYKELKSIYNHRDWTSAPDDRYDPEWMSICSFIIPGLGQMICGEVGRGFGWFGGAAGCWALMGLGAGLEAYGETMYDGAPNSAMVTAGAILSIAACIGLGTIEVCSVIDATRVAKVKNMYDRDLRQRNYSLNLYPSVDCVKMASGVQPTAGLTLAMRF